MLTYSNGVIERGLVTSRMKNTVNVKFKDGKQKIFTCRHLHKIDDIDAISVSLHVRKFCIISLHKNFTQFSKCFRSPLARKAGK